MNQQLLSGAKLFIKQRPNNVSRNLDGEVVLLTPEDYTVHALNEIGAVIWRACEKPTTIDELVGMLLEEYEVPEEELRVDVVEFVDDLVQKGILEILDTREY